MFNLKVFRRKAFPKFEDFSYYGVVCFTCHLAIYFLNSLMTAWNHVCLRLTNFKLYNRGIHSDQRLWLSIQSYTHSSRYGNLRNWVSSWRHPIAIPTFVVIMIICVNCSPQMKICASLEHLYGIPKMEYNDNMRMAPHDPAWLIKLPKCKHLICCCHCSRCTNLLCQIYDDRRPMHALLGIGKDYLRDQDVEWLSFHPNVRRILKTLNSKSVITKAETRGRRYLSK